MSKLTGTGSYPPGDCMTPLADRHRVEEPRVLATIDVAGPDDRDAVDGDHAGRPYAHERRAWAVFGAGPGVVPACARPDRRVVAHLPALACLGARRRAGAGSTARPRARRAAELRGSGEQPGR